MQVNILHVDQSQTKKKVEGDGELSKVDLVAINGWQDKGTSK
jgi:hypothetical protein